MKKHFRVLMMTLTLVLALIPLAVFANGDEGSETKPVSLTYQGADILYYPNTDYEPDGFRNVDNKITETYSDGSIKTYICKEYTDEGGDKATSYFLNGDTSMVTDEYGDSYFDVFEFDIPDSGIPEGTDKLKFRREYYDDDLEDWTYVTGEVKVKQHPKPISLTYQGSKLYYVAGEWPKDFYTANNKIIQTFSDGSTETYICKEYTDEYGEKVTDYFLNGDTSIVTDGDDEKYYPYRQWFGIDVPDGGIKAGTKEVAIYRNDDYGDDEIKVIGKVPVTEYPKPISATFTGKAQPVYIGQKTIGLEYLHNKGNIITVATILA